MTRSLQFEFNEIENCIQISGDQRKDNLILSLNIKLLIEKFEKKEFQTDSIAVKLILPKSIVFEPLQNDHITINPFIISQNYILSWKIQCLKLPCLMSKIIIEITF